MAYPYLVYCREHGPEQPPRPNRWWRWVQQRERLFQRAGIPRMRTGSQKDPLTECRRRCVRLQGEIHHHERAKERRKRVASWIEGQHRESARLDSLDKTLTRWERRLTEKYLVGDMTLPLMGVSPKEKAQEEEGLVLRRSKRRRLIIEKQTSSNLKLMKWTPEALKVVRGVVRARKSQTHGSHSSERMTKGSQVEKRDA